MAVALPDGTLAVWRSRHHRKGLYRFAPGEWRAAGLGLRHTVWMPHSLNWWIGIVFAAGALLFLAGSVLALAPTLARALSLGPGGVNAVFFAGSVPFSVAAYLQLFQAANRTPFPAVRIAAPPRRVWFGWAPRNIGWLSCALQFPGTLLFNLNTLDAMLPGLNWWQQDVEVWLPNFVGSVLFLASGLLAFAETCHGYFAWKPASLSWWVTVANLFGCVAFMVSALFAFVPPAPFAVDATTISLVFTLLGAAGFLIGSLLMLPEAAQPASAVLALRDRRP